MCCKTQLAHCWLPLSRTRQKMVLPVWLWYNLHCLVFFFFFVVLGLNCNLTLVGHALTWSIVDVQITDEESLVNYVVITCSIQGVSDC